MIDRRSVLLVAVSTVVALAMCEAGLRLLGFGSDRAFQARPGVDGTDLTVARQYVESLPAGDGTERAWFAEDPPALTNRGKPEAAAVARFQDFARRGIYAAQAQYIWNRRFVEKAGCGPDSPFRNYPPGIPVFDTPGGTPHPTFRFPPSATLPSGLVTNRFGLRGPEIERVKPGRTVRIAFVGASTTVGVHGHAFSYPERVGAWLNRFAAANRLDVRFEALNAGREGITSSDIAAIVSEELVPLDPDIVVYYEGSNQFLKSVFRSVGSVPGSSWAHHGWLWLREHTATVRLLSRSRLFAGSGEPWKPPHRLRWPAGVDEQSPEVDSPSLPLLLPVIVRDLDRIRGALRPSGGSLVLCSFSWLAAGGLRITAAENPHIWRHLNEDLWPLRYAEVRQLAGFQNAVFRRYAGERNIGFLDVASQLPQDPRLFSDAIHLLDSGERLKAWIVFQQLLPLLRREIAAGRLPRAATGTLPAPPSLSWATDDLRCR